VKIAAMRASILLAVTSSFAWVACEGPAADSADGVSAVPSIEVEKYELANGLEVLLVEDHRLPLVAVNLWYHVGPVNEEPNRTGFAHLFEHMMFEGSAHAPDGEHARLLIAAGATGLNGSTDFDRTNYYETVPSDQLELALWLESDRMGFMLEELDPVRLATQQDVVRNERRQNLDNRPYGIVDEAVYHTLFPDGHPYYGAVIGSHDDIQAATLDNVRDFFRLYYAPNNATLALVGDIDPAAARTLVQQYFGTLRAGEPVTQPNVTTPPITSERRVTIEDRVELPVVYMAWFTPAAFEPGDADAHVLSDILARGQSSRLYRSLVYEGGIAQSLEVRQESLELGSIFHLRATARPGYTPEELEEAIDTEIEALRVMGPEAAEVDRARNTIETEVVQGLENLGLLADRLNRYNHYTDDPGYLAEDLAALAAVTPASIQSFVARYLSSEARVVVYGVPGEPQHAPDVPAPAPSPVAATIAEEFLYPNEPWRSEAPPPGPARDVELPVPQSFELANGLTVLVNERPELPIVSASLVVRRGNSDNPGDRPGLATLTADMLSQGTATRSALEISEAVAQLGASLEAVAVMDAVRVNVTSLRRAFPETLAILADVVVNPSFPAAELERRRESHAASVVQEGDNAFFVAERAVFRSLFGEGHPLGYRATGVESSIRAATRDDVLAFWSSHFVPSNSAIVVSGQVTVDELRPMLEESFGRWGPAEGAPSIPSDARPTDARLVLVDRPGASQTELRVVTLGVPRSTPDYEALVLLNTILGGGGVSNRINLNLREEHGWTYGALSEFVFRRLGGLFYIGTPVRLDATAPAVVEILNELRRIRDEPVTGEELAFAKDRQIRSMMAPYQTSAGATANSTNIHVYELGSDYYTQLGSRLAAVTIEDVQAAARRYFEPDQMIVVAVGDLATIREPLEALGRGRVEIRDVEGNVIP
jgi:zinc protease